MVKNTRIFKNEIPTMKCQTFNDPSIKSRLQTDSRKEYSGRLFFPGAPEKNEEI